MSEVEGLAHTGQIPAILREQRKDQFHNGQLSALFCSPTMELGTNILDLNVVQMRNVLPSAANYAQRSGRAGRGGQPALIAAFCSEGSPHDQYFFRRLELMVSGAVVLARLELTNQDLVEAHIHSAWLAATGIGRGKGMQEVLNLDRDVPNQPFSDDIQHRLSLSGDKDVILRVECRRILESSGDEFLRAFWFNPGWLEGVLRDAPVKLTAGESFTNVPYSSGMNPANSKTVRLLPRRNVTMHGVIVWKLRERLTFS